MPAGPGGVGAARCPQCLGHCWPLRSTMSSFLFITGNKNAVFHCQGITFEIGTCYIVLIGKEPLWRETATLSRNLLSLSSWVLSCLGLKVVLLVFVGLCSVSHQSTLFAFFCFFW